MTKNQKLFELDELADKVGEFIQYWGFKKVHGKIWCYLFLSKSPLDAQFLIDRLGISKALVSQSLSELKEFKVIVDLGKGERNTTVYSSNPELTEVIFGVLRSREKKMLCQTYAAFRLLEDLSDQRLDSDGIDRDKLQRLGTMIRFAERFLSSVLAFEKLDFGQWKTIFK
jgi:DNA-binding transcriptional regulator GbsR (MarR family)